MTKLTIYIGSDGYNVRVPEDVALREFDAWALFEQRSADAIAEAVGRPEVRRKMSESQRRRRGLPVSD